MKQITADEFYKMITENPSVFEFWNTPLEITELVDCYRSPITHLSKHLIFSGRDDDGDVADFSRCPNLRIATGTFHGFVYFHASNIQKIENLNVIKRNKKKWSASFTSCTALNVATGNYTGFVSFANSGIHSIHNLHIQHPDKDDCYTNFWNCPNLHSLEGWDIFKTSEIEPEKLEAEIKRRNALKKFHKENKIETLPFL
jgi:hypothetical protein